MRIQWTNLYLFGSHKYENKRKHNHINISFYLLILRQKDYMCFQKKERSTCKTKRSVPTIVRVAIKIQKLE